MAQTVNVGELPLPQLELLKGQLDQVGSGWRGLCGAEGGSVGSGPPVWGCVGTGWAGRGWGMMCGA